MNENIKAAILGALEGNPDAKKAFEEILETQAAKAGAVDINVVDSSGHGRDIRDVDYLYLMDEVAKEQGNRGRNMIHLLDRVEPTPEMVNFWSKSFNTGSATRSVEKDLGALSYPVPGPRNNANDVATERFGAIFSTHVGQTSLGEILLSLATQIDANLRLSALTKKNPKMQSRNQREGSYMYTWGPNNCCKDFNYHRKQGPKSRRIREAY